ncbi:MAG TPA: fatty acid desaturase [Tepidisphaeraceae bacterium]|jgi:stearoyl-CoA desaturase (delta-9 desaturase)|nr:fatty acid desaturase [Tepidisphaeraceae bacterium]
MSILRSQARQQDYKDPHPLTFRDRACVLIGVASPPIGLAVAIILLWRHGVGPLDLILMATMYLLTLLGITLGYHRLFTHRSFVTPPAVRFTLAALGSMATQGPVIQWVAHHRRHHQQSDQEGDPHSPHLHDGSLWSVIRQAWHAHAGWLFEQEPADLRRSVPDLLADPVVSFVDRTFWYWVALGLLIPAACGLAITHSWYGAATAFLWGGLVRMAFTHHVTGSINSVCHIWGSKDFVSSDESRNNTLFGILAFGEGWHNNHHAFPTSARHGLKWYQFDLTWLTIRTLSFFRLAKNVRLPTPTALELKQVPTPLSQPSISGSVGG